MWSPARWRAGLCRGMLRSLVVTSPSPPQHLPSDLWGLICCCHLPLICEQAGMSLGERVGRRQRDAWKEGFISPPALRGWRRNLPPEFCNFCLAWSRGKKNCKLMTALKQALEEFEGYFNYLQVEILRKGKVGGRSSWSLRQSGDCGVKGVLNDRNNAGASLFRQIHN